jgi:hypothetical protein
MLPVVGIGALLVICGVLFMARAAIFRGNMSEPHATTATRATPVQSGDVTLEPNRRGLRFLGLGPNWPGILMIAAGALMLLWGVL